MLNPVLEQAASPATRAADEAEVHQLFQRLIACWNCGDGHTYAALFTEDSDYVAFDGTHFRGRQANAQNHQKLFDTFLKGSTLEGQGIDRLRFLTPDVALLHTTGTVKLRWQSKPAPGRRSIQTLVVVREPEGWRFAAFHNTRIQKRTLVGTLLLMLGKK